MLGASPAGAPARAETGFTVYLPQVSRASLPANPNGSRIALGMMGHICAITPTGGVKCWGDNGVKVPKEVPKLGAPVAALAAGYGHTCALTVKGGVKCWGFNDYGVLGDLTTTRRRYPVDVRGLSSGIKAISAGRFHNCALTVKGGVVCWGANGYGQLGIGTYNERHAPEKVVGLGAEVIAISAGDFHTCALTVDGGVKCWGILLGNGTKDLSLKPVDVNGLSSGVIAISAGLYSTCVVTANNKVKCWGSNWGALGDGTSIERLAPVDVIGLEADIIDVSVGFETTCALTGTGGAKCWGLNMYGEIGDGTKILRSTPVDVFGLQSGVIAIDPGAQARTCAMLGGGGVKCWGLDSGTTPTDVIEFP